MENIRKYLKYFIKKDHFEKESSNIAIKDTPNGILVTVKDGDSNLIDAICKEMWDAPGIITSVSDNKIDIDATNCRTIYDGDSSYGPYSTDYDNFDDAMKWLVETSEWVSSCIYASRVIKDPSYEKTATKELNKIYLTIEGLELDTVPGLLVHKIACDANYFRGIVSNIIKENIKLIKDGKADTLIRLVNDKTDGVGGHFVREVFDATNVPYTIK